MEIEKRENGPDSCPFALVHQGKVLAWGKTENAMLFLEWYYVFLEYQEKQPLRELEMLSEMIQTFIK